MSYQPRGVGFALRRALVPLVLPGFALSAWAQAPPRESVPQVIEFNRDIRPILSDNSFDKIALDIPAGESMDTVRQRNSFPAAPRPVRRQP